MLVKKKKLQNTNKLKVVAHASVAGDALDQLL